jgi:hypothetical protein
VSSYPIGVTKTLQNWRFNSAHVERVLDNSMVEAANPDNTLILAGPARRNVASADPGSPRGMLALGMLQSMAFNTQVPVQPLQAIGSARPFFLRGKSQTTWNMSRVMINGRNLLRALYHNAVLSGINADKFDDPAALENAPRSQYFINLDSELFYLPVGIGMLMRAKDHNMIAACYLEVCVITGYGFATGAGQNAMAESITGVCDRVLPWSTSDAMQASFHDRNALDAVLGLAANTFPTPARDRVVDFQDDGLADGNVGMLT